MSSRSAKCARQSQIMQNISNGVYLRKALQSLDGKFTTKHGKVRDVKIQQKLEWEKFFASK